MLHNKKIDINNNEITNYTSTMWKYLPISENELEKFPEYENKTLNLNKSDIISAKVRGKKHKYDGTNCDDWYEISSFEDIIFIALADGAGSKKFSYIGAKKSCETAINYLKKEIEILLKENPNLFINLNLDISNEICLNTYKILAEIIQKSVIKAFESVKQEFTLNLNNENYIKILNRDLKLTDFAGTLITTIIIPINNEKLVVTCQIGDGVVALINTNESFENCLKLMSTPDIGQFSGETDFLTSLENQDIKMLQKHTKITKGNFEIALILSDGVSDDYFPNEIELKRLYFDLILNGIIKTNVKNLTKEDLTIQQKELFEKMPEPLKYPWINNKEIEIGLYYTKELCKAIDISLKDIWENQSILEIAKIKMELEKINTINDLSEKLKIWLDNYVERGSFD